MAKRTSPESTEAAPDFSSDLSRRLDEAFQSYPEKNRIRMKQRFKDGPSRYFERICFEGDEMLALDRDEDTKRVWLVRVKKSTHVERFSPEEGGVRFLRENVSTDNQGLPQGKWRVKDDQLLGADYANTLLRLVDKLADTEPIAGSKSVVPSESGFYGPIASEITPPGS